MAGLTDPTLNPLATTTQTTSTTAPDFYNNAMSNLFSDAQKAITSGGVAGPSALQTQAYEMAPTAINAGKDALTSATNIATGAAGAPDINQYLDPFRTNVVDEMGRLGQRNFNELLAPAATAGAAGSGQFGSRRGMQVYGNVARDVAADILGKQYGALSTGYQNAVTAAQNEQNIQNQLAQTLGSLSGAAYTQGVGGLDVLSKLGAQQQATEQAKLNYPMTALQNAATVMRGFTIPTSVSQTTTQPAGVGQIQLSPLSQIGSLIGTLGTVANQKISGVTGDKTLGQWLGSKLSDLFGSQAQPEFTIKSPQGTDITWDPTTKQWLDKQYGIPYTNYSSATSGSDTTTSSGGGGNIDTGSISGGQASTGTDQLAYDEFGNLIE
jgi:hypothetical protein